MAHEIKNLCQPIKLLCSKNRKLREEQKVSNTEFFTNCTSTIVRQVNSIENLVSEFSNFARMPDRNLKLASLDNIILNQINTQKK